MLVLPALSVTAWIISEAFLLKYDILEGLEPDNDAVWYAFFNVTEAAIIIDLIINWTVTILIVGRLYWVGHRSGGMHANKYMRVILAFVESGFLLSVNMVLYLGFYASPKPVSPGELQGSMWTSSG